MLRIIGIGGGTGLAVTLSGLKKLAQDSGLDPPLTRVGISAVVSVADNGGSSGLLRDNLGIPAVGDLRNCIVALCSDNPLLANLFRHRFSQGTGLQGHSLGNLILAALCQQSGSLGRAIKRASREQKNLFIQLWTRSILLTVEKNTFPHNFREFFAKNCEKTQRINCYSIN